MENPGSRRPADRLRELLARRGALPLLGGLAVIVAVAIVALALAAGGGDDGNATGESGGLVSGTPLATPEATVELSDPSVVATRDPNTPIPGTTDGDRLIIAKFGVNAPLSLKVVGGDGVMPNPNGPDDAAYYDFSAWPGLGGTPGSGGNVVISGHVDSGRAACKNGTVPPPCQAVFWDIGKLRTGDEIELLVAGQSHKYKVTGNQSLDAATTNWTQVVSSKSEESITLITCAGDFNPVTREYNHRQVVTGVRI